MWPWSQIKVSLDYNMQVRAIILSFNAKRCMTVFFFDLLVFVFLFQSFKLKVFLCSSLLVFLSLFLFYENHSKIISPKNIYFNHYQLSDRKIISLGPGSARKQYHEQSCQTKDKKTITNVTWHLKQENGKLSYQPSLKSCRPHSCSFFGRESDHGVQQKGACNNSVAF